MGLLALVSLAALVLGVGVGSVWIPPGQVVGALASSLFGLPLPQEIDPVIPGLISQIRLPRVLTAFFTGAALSMSGTVMQSVLRNPLASPFGLGISAGAGVGAALVMVLGLSSGLLGMFLMPVVSLSFGLGTVLLVMAFSTRVDRNLSNTTIVLIGMVMSLFLNAILSMLAATSTEYAQRINLWTLGSFSMKGWECVRVLVPVTLAGLLLFFAYAREMDVMTFGEEQAAALGVNLKRVKWVLMGAVAVLTGTAVSLVGIIGFVDLIAPHVVRRFFGSSHRRVLPASALFGGTFMVLCDLASRTLTPPREIPIGSITALIGAPFFVYLYFRGRRRQ